MNNKYLINTIPKVKPLTYIIGAKTLDGIVMVADKRIFDGSEFTIGNKIFVCNDVLIGCAGYGGAIEMFKLKLNSKIKEELKDSEIIEVIEDTMREINDRYMPRLKVETGLLECLVVFKSKIDNSLRLFRIKHVGYPEPIKTYGAIGSGEPYGAVFLKKTYEILWDEYEKHKDNLIEKISDNTSIVYPKPDMIKVSGFLAFAVGMVETLKVEITVGGGLDIWIFPNGGKPREPLDKEMEEIGSEFNLLLSEINLGQWYKNGEFTNRIDFE